eukprot:1645438-Amphidinium_carterae.1
MRFRIPAVHGRCVEQVAVLCPCSCDTGWLTKELFVTDEGGGFDGESMLVCVCVFPYVSTAPI